MPKKTISVHLDKSDLLRMVKGLQPPYGGMGKWTKFIGNQWNENWEWDLTKFQDLTEEELWKSYNYLKENIK